MSKKLLIATLVAVVLFLALYGCVFGGTAEAQSEPRTQEASTAPMGVFRDFVWGVSESDVLSVETAVYYKKEGNSLFFLLPKDRSITPAIKPIIRYDFKDDKLVSAEYGYFELEAPDPQIIMDMFTEQEIKLSTQFGKPSKEEFNWKNERYRKFPQFWPRALYSRDLWLKTTWEQGDTEVVLHAYREKHGYKLFYTASKIAPQTTVPKDVLQLDIAPSAKP